MLKIQKNKCRNIDVCKRCDNFIESMLLANKCRCDLDSGYLEIKFEETLHFAWMHKNQYIKYKLNKQCPYILEQTVLRKKL